MVKLKSENMYKILLENLPQKIFIKDKKLVYVSCNKNYARDLKIEISEIVGKTDRDFHSKKLAERYRIDDKRIIESGTAEDFEEEYLKDGRKAFVHTVKTPVRDDKGNIVGILGIFWDISEQKRMLEELRKYHVNLENMVESRTVELKKEIAERKVVEKELRESKNKYKTLLENLPQKVFLLDRNLAFVSCNKSFVQNKKIRSEEIAGKTDYDFFSKAMAEKYRADDRRIIKSGKTEEIEDKYIIGGKEFTECTIKCPAKNEHGNIIGLLGISWDITKRKETERILKKQKLALEQKNIALSEIIAQIEVEKRKMKDDIAANVNELLLPILEKLKLEKTAGKYIDLLKNHLGELVSSFGRNIRGKRLNLTPREIEICGMVKGGLTSKEISNLLNISYQTIEKHRKNIRRKMGISKKNINLSSLLQTI